MRNSTYSFLLCCLFVAFPLTVFAGKLKQDPKLVSGVLPNGLTYSIYPNDYPKGEAVFRLFIKSGSVFEDANQSGLAHFLEHMAFNGTKHFQGNSLVQFLESKGAKFGKDLNAHTSFNETVYKLQLPSQDPMFVDTVLTLLADWADGFLLDSAEIEKERGVIFSEWLSKAGPEKDVQNAFLMDILNGSKYADRLVIGDTAVILHFPHERIREFYKRWYHPSRMEVAIAGDVDVRRTEQTIKKLFGGITRPDVPEVELPTIPPYERVKAIVMVHEQLPKIEFNRMQLLPLLPPISTTSGYETYLRQMMLNRLMSARFTALSYENPPYKNGGASISGFLNAKSVFMASAELVPNKVDTGIHVFSRHLEQMIRYGFIQSEIEKQKKSYLAALKRSMLSKNPIASSTYMEEQYATFFRGDLIITPAEEYRLAKNYLGKIDSLNMVTYLHQTIEPNRTHYMLTAFGKKADFPKEDSLITLATKAQKEPVEPYLNPFDIPETLLEKEPAAGKIVGREELPDINAVKLTLSNGATVYFRRSQTKRSQLTLSGFRQGGQYALEQSDFVSGLFTDNIVGLSGAGSFSREALSQFLAGNSASVRFLIDRTRSGVAGNADLTDKETLFQLLYLKWTQPKADVKLFKQVQSKAIESYRTENRTPSMLFQREMGYLLQGKTYVNRELTDTLLEKELAYERLLPVFQQMYGSANGYTFVLTGDCDVNDLTPLITRYLAALPSSKAVTSYRYKGTKTPTKPQVLEHRTDENPRSTVMMVFQKDSIGTDYQLSEMKAEVLQDVLRSKLLTLLREQMGMVYSVSVSVAATRHPSELSRVTVSFSCLPQNVTLLMDTTLALVRQMTKDPELFTRELSDVKTNLIKEMQLNVQKDSFWSSYIRNALFNNDSDWLFSKRYPELVQSLTNKQLVDEIQQRILSATLIKGVLYPKEKK